MKKSLQVQKAVAKAMQMLGMLKRSFKFLSRDSTHFYSCVEVTSDHILNTVHNLGHHIWQKTSMSWSKYNIVLQS